VDPDYLAPSSFVDSDSEPVRDFARRAVGSVSDPSQQAVRLFEAVRDDIWYDPFTVSTDPETYRASAVATSTANWCVPKAVLLTAAARAVGIPARLGFADVRNHLQTPKLRERMRGVDVFAYHGYTDLRLDGRWVKATPAFNAELCARFGVAPIAFDGRTDALLHEYTPGGGRYMEYVRDRGVHTDLPLDEILATFQEVYGAGMFAQADAAERGDDTFAAPAR
jgi:transglutaminase-like putative cysteine protease